ncbi:hypothetical protein CTAYLR_001071 [Chrysophaeum taylorii]|uniref:Dynein light chain n=1 Tax=Chrysophaeum taylorii TaxID=2483200 RepID=A0AAD7UGA5_9STRA|nr:hypothetical protein CTAYLR_001071 [Chrysophaeum taylorii]
MADGGEQEHSFMWGAQVRLPCDMPDDILKDAIESVRTELDAVEDFEGAGGNQVVERIKRKFDDKWNPNWCVIIGRSYGSFVTHETRKFVSFKIYDKAVMMYKV